MASINIRSANPEHIKSGPLTSRQSARGDRILAYSLPVTHSQLHEHKIVTAPDLSSLQDKVQVLIDSWDERYKRVALQRTAQSKKDSADAETTEAQKQLESLDYILRQGLDISSLLNWDSLRDSSEYRAPTFFPEKEPLSLPLPPPEYSSPNIPFFIRLLGRRQALLDEAERAHHEAICRWQATEEASRAAFEKAHAIWEARKAAFWSLHEEKREAHFEKRVAHNREIDVFAAAVEEGDANAIVEQIKIVLAASDYGGLFDKRFEVQYKSDEKLALVDYTLPAPDVLPQLQSVRYVRSSGEAVSKYITDKQAKIYFEKVAYQICLRTIHELFRADVHGHINSVLFNGSVDFVDKRTGQDSRSCVLSILVERVPFQHIDLSRVEPKTCFKTLKGVSAGSLGLLTPIPPIMDLNRTDRRFVDARAVTQAIDASTNLASMAWEDFEHLVRELFEKEFESRGGEVKITQASRDGGVDAVAFDPDPITGGKIVIQAKRYTRTVGVSAVRDLYGTVMNEGASRGILVTTADYGPDAYDFANGKPLQLMNGANLLYLLERHGYSARIDVHQARLAAAT